MTDLEKALKKELAKRCHELGEAKQAASIWRARARVAEKGLENALIDSEHDSNRIRMLESQLDQNDKALNATMIERDEAEEAAKRIEARLSKLQAEQVMGKNAQIWAQFQPAPKDDAT